MAGDVVLVARAIGPVFLVVLPDMVGVGFPVQVGVGGRILGAIHIREPILAVRPHKAEN